MKLLSEVAPLLLVIQHSSPDPGSVISHTSCIGVFFSVNNVSRMFCKKEKKYNFRKTLNSFACSCKMFAN